MPKKFVGKNIPYKYVILKVRSGEIRWEKLPQPKGINVNRCLNVPINFASFLKIDDVIWKYDAFDEKDIGRHGRGRNLSMIVMAPKRCDLMESNEVDGLISLGFRVANIKYDYYRFYKKVGKFQRVISFHDLRTSTRPIVRLKSKNYRISEWAEFQDYLFSILILVHAEIRFHHWALSFQSWL